MFIKGEVFEQKLVNELRDKGKLSILSTTVCGLMANNCIGSILVRTIIGPFAAPEYIQQAPNLPKTRSGKIMRRFLRKIAVDDHELGDTSTLADETVIDQLFGYRREGLACSG